MIIKLKLLNCISAVCTNLTEISWSIINVRVGRRPNKNTKQALGEQHNSRKPPQRWYAWLHYMRRVLRVAKWVFIVGTVLLSTSLFIFLSLAFENWFLFLHIWFELVNGLSVWNDLVSPIPVFASDQSVVEQLINLKRECLRQLNQIGLLVTDSTGMVNDDLARHLKKIDIAWAVFLSKLALYGSLKWAIRGESLARLSQMHNFVYHTSKAARDELINPDTIVGSWEFLYMGAHSILTLA